MRRSRTRAGVIREAAVQRNVDLAATNGDRHGHFNIWAAPGGRHERGRRRPALRAAGVRQGRLGPLDRCGRRLPGHPSGGSGRGVFRAGGFHGRQVVQGGDRQMDGPLYGRGGGGSREAGRRPHGPACERSPVGSSRMERRTQGAVRQQPVLSGPPDRHHRLGQPLEGPQGPRRVAAARPDLLVPVRDGLGSHQERVGPDRDSGGGGRAAGDAGWLRAQSTPAGPECRYTHARDCNAGARNSTTDTGPRAYHAYSHSGACPFRCEVRPGRAGPRLRRLRYLG